MGDRASQDRLRRKRARERAVTNDEAASASEVSGSQRGALQSQITSNAAAIAVLQAADTKFRVRGRRTSTQPIVTATPTFVIFNAADDFDFTGWHGSDDTFTVPTGGAGFYVISAFVAWAAPGANAALTIEITINGTAVPETVINDVVSGQARNSFVACARELVATDVVKVRVTQTAGSNLNLNSAALTVAKVSE